MLLEILAAIGGFTLVRSIWGFFARRRGAQRQGGREMQPYHPQQVMAPQQGRRGRQQPMPEEDAYHGGMPMPGGVTDFEITITGRHYDFR